MWGLAVGILSFLSLVLSHGVRRVSWSDGYEDDNEFETLGEGVERIERSNVRHPKQNVFLVNQDAESLATKGLYEEEAEEPVVHTNGPAMTGKPTCLPVDNPINEGWFMFRFGAQGSEASRYFRFHSTVWTRLELTDLFCNGDRFKIINRQDDQESVIGESSQITFDECATYEVDPQAAMGDGNWSRAVSYLAPGAYSLHLVVKQSPYGGGSAAIRFTEIDASEVPRSTTSTSTVQVQTSKKPASATGAGIAAGATRFVSMRPLHGSQSTTVTTGHRRGGRSSSPARRGVVTSSGVPVEVITRDSYTSRTVNGPSHVTVHRPARSQAQTTTPGRRRNLYHLQAREVCAGWEDFVVLIGNYRGGEVEEVCAAHGFDASMIPISGVERKGAARSVSHCLGPYKQAWIYSYEDYYEDGNITLQAKKDKCRVLEQTDDLLLPVLCRLPQLDDWRE